MSNECVFCARIRSGEYDVSGFGAVSFEPLNPVTLGHRLFLPIKHVKDARDQHWLGAAMTLASWWGSGQGLDFNLITSCGPAATQTVWHLHVHYVPRRDSDGLSLPWTEQGRRPALDGAQQPSKWRRNPACVERWPECADGEYNPACCRFPKACSCDEPIGEQP